MGSSGPSKISDYPASSKGSGGEPGQDDGAGGGGGDGQPPSDRCGKAFSVILQDVEHSDYYKAQGAPPSRGRTLQITQQKRLVAEDPSGQGVGNLPTSYNYLASCLKEGWTYSGSVTAVTKSATGVSITADFAAIAP